MVTAPGSPSAPRHSSFIRRRRIDQWIAYANSVVQE
jgi:hypothetical protein